MKSFFVMALVQISAAFIGGLFAWPVLASRLDARACEVLREQRQEMVKAGIGQMLDRGAQWGAQHLNDSQLDDVAKFLNVMEQIRFRCAQSRQDAKSKFGLLANVPLPTRNMRRLSGVKAAQNGSSASAEKKPDSVGDGASKAVLSAVEEGNGRGGHNKIGKALRPTLAN